MKQKNTTPYVKGYKYRIYPTDSQKEQLAKIFGSCRYVYNRLLAESKVAYLLYKEDPTKTLKPSITGISLCYFVTAWKQQEETSWLAENPAQVIQQPAHHLADAYQKAFKSKKGFPCFKKREGRQSAVFTTQSYTLRSSVLQLAKFEEPMRIVWSRDLPTDKPGPCTISKTPSGKYYASFMCEYVPEKTHGEGIVGIDAGITDLATISNGITIANLRYYVKSQTRLAAAQRSLSRKKKGSKNRTKARLKVALCHEHIANQRNDYLHKLTTSLVCENQAIAIERLSVSNMVKNHKLAKHILDASWGKMREYLTYKAIASQHCVIILADPYYPSTQLCSTCGWHPGNRIKLGVTSWKCEHCGDVHSRDLNAAVNLELLGRSLLDQETLLGHHHNVIIAPNYRSAMMQ